MNWVSAQKHGSVRDALPRPSAWKRCRANVPRSVFGCAAIQLCQRHHELGIGDTRGELRANNDVKGALVDVSDDVLEETICGSQAIEVFLAESTEVLASADVKHAAHKNSRSGSEGG